jgi:hypothetical protein
MIPRRDSIHGWVLAADGFPPTVQIVLLFLVFSMITDKRPGWKTQIIVCPTVDTVSHISKIPPIEF